ncbi:hypothetical protein FDV78_11660 [Vibrio parahaemolyticus]|nr:hypothetical protein FDV78_11660 [Vibrio parahaemolyticus]
MSIALLVQAPPLCTVPLPLAIAVSLPCALISTLTVWPSKRVVSQYERTVIIDCLNACNWHTKKAAEQLALPMSTLNHKMKKYDISAAG